MVFRVRGALIAVLAAAALVACTAPGGVGAPSPTAVGVVPPGGSGTISVVAAENFYGDLAQQLGGSRVTVYSVLNDPSVDPHEYESRAADARAVSTAQIVIENGLGYDSFMDKLLQASPRPARQVINVGQLTGHRTGDNPHVWYQPQTMPAVARQLVTVMTQIDPSSGSYFAARLTQLKTSLQPLDGRIATMKARDAGVKVIATEPVFDYMAEAVGLDVVDKDGPFQMAVASGNDPPASAVVSLRQQITSHAVKALIYNAQTVTPVTTQMQDLAKQNHVPVVGVSELEPKGKTYQQWMLDQLQELQQALGG